MVHLLSGVGGILLILLALWDAFRTVVLPRRMTGTLHLLGFFFRFLWPLWAKFAERMRGSSRENLLSIYSALALLLQIALWATGLIVGFGLVQWSFPAALDDPAGPEGLDVSLYFSGVTFLTLGFGDVLPMTPLARLFAVVEAGVGFAFLALVMGYLPMLYQAFSRREVLISLLDARAGSPPSAGELLRRYGPDADLLAMLADCEVWSAELLESHMSYPALGFFRSQHEKQSWVATLTTILDVCAILLARAESMPTRQAQFTFAMARHVAVDLVQIFNVEPSLPPPERLGGEEQQRLWQTLADAGFSLRESREAQVRFAQLREMYEPYVDTLACFLRMPLPNWLPTEQEQDAWEASPYDDVHWYRISQKR